MPIPHDPNYNGPTQLAQSDHDLIRTTAADVANILVLLRGDINSQTGGLLGRFNDVERDVKNGRRVAWVVCAAVIGLLVNTLWGVLTRGH